MESLAGRMMSALVLASCACDAGAVVCLGEIAYFRYVGDTASEATFPP